MGPQGIFQLLVGVFYGSGNVDGADAVELQDIVDGFLRHDTPAGHGAGGLPAHDGGGHVQDGIFEQLLVALYTLANLLIEDAHDLTSLSGDS